MKRLLSLITFLVATAALAQHELALTFDDLTSQLDGTTAHQQDLTTRILAALKTHNAPAIGFVNEKKLYESGDTPGKKAILKMWVDQGIPLGNHTYSHKGASQSTIDEFKADIIKGSLFSRQLMKEAGLPYVYFRYPFFDRGNTPEKRKAIEAFLKEQGYIESFATIDTLDWNFNSKMLTHPEHKEQLHKTYLASVWAKLAAKAASKTIWKRHHKEVIVMHVNELTADTLDAIMQMALQLGYTFVPLDYEEKNSPLTGSAPAG